MPLVVTPKRLAGGAAAIAFTWAAVRTNSPLPLVVAVNSAMHHVLYPSSRLWFAADVGYNVVMITWHALRSAYVMRWAPGFALGWAAGHAWGGCTTWPGAIAHVCLCQLPAAYVITHMHDND